MGRIHGVQQEAEPRPAPVRPQTRWRLLNVGVFAGCGLIILVVGLAVGITLGYLVAHRGATNVSETTPTTEKITWTCSMHPQIKLPKPGKCPICFMDLIPLTSDADDEGSPRQLTLSPRAVALAEIETTPVRRRYATAEIRMVGKVDYDETKVADITAWVGGRLDRLFVDYTGIAVRKGDHLVSLYSPDLIVAQKELLLTWKAHNRPDNPAPELTASTLASTEEKLRLLGVLPGQIEAIKQRGSPSDHLTVYSPIGGIVIEKLANEGMYVKTGTKIYTIADLSVVWINLEAYESDLPWLRYGQQVEFTTESHPGENFKGHIAFIDPIVDEKTRTVRVRVDAPNPDGKLKPGMFVRAVVRSRLAADGRVFDTSLLGKMPQRPLLIPASAPLVTGKRAVVYVRLPNTEKPTFEGREVVLGPRAAGHYIVRRGLDEGELVVTNGSFKIDSALQIQARPSMMSPETGADPSSHGKESGNAQ